MGFTLREIGLLLVESDDSAIDGPRMQVLAQAQLAKIDGRIARLGLVRQYMAAVAGGDLQLLHADAECRFLIDFLAAAPQTTASAA